MYNKKSLLFISFGIICFDNNSVFSAEHLHADTDLQIENNDSFFMAMGNNSRIEIHGADSKKKNFTVLSRTANTSKKFLNLQESAKKTGWEVGDQIAVIKNGLQQGYQNVNIRKFEGAKTLLKQPLKDTFYGQSPFQVKNGKSGKAYRKWNVDQRAEVALLSRNVIISGRDEAVSDGFGGHVMAMHGAEMHLSGTEFKRMGQKDILGRYPVHWHMLGDKGSGQYIKNCSIHNSYNKGITIHGTNNVRVEQNVVGDTIGHSFFLEDGSETGNSFWGNIGFGTKATDSKTPIIRSDKKNVATYWITNPKNDFILNTAAGSDNGGFWYALDHSIQGLSSTNKFYKNKPSPVKERFGVFKGNIMHSNRAGLFRSANEDFRPSSRLEFRDIARHPNTLEILDSHLYANREWSVAAPGNGKGHINIKNSSISASEGGLFFDNSGISMYDSLFYGDVGYDFYPLSKLNIDDNSSNVQDSTMGIQSYSGRSFIFDCHFEGFGGDKTPYALVSMKGGTTDTVYKGITFNNPKSKFEVQFYGRSRDNVRHNRASYDMDGSLSGYKKSYLTHNTLPGNANSTSFVHEAQKNDGKMNVYINQNSKIVNIRNAWKGRFKNKGPIVLNRHKSMEDYLAGKKGEPCHSSASTVAYLGDGNNYAYYYKFHEKDPVETRGLTFTSFNKHDRDFVFLIIDDVTVNHFASNCLRTSRRKHLKNAAVSTYFYSNGKMFVKYFLRDDDLWFGLSSKTLPIDKVPQQKYKILSYTAEELDMKNIFKRHKFVKESQKYAYRPELFSKTYSSKTYDYVPCDSNCQCLSRWSNRKTWEDSNITSDSIVIVRDKVLLDESVRVKGLIVDGGIFVVEDEVKNINLTADWILVINGGLFQVGTEKKPYEKEFTLKLVGANKNQNLDIGSILKGSSKFKVNKDKFSGHVMHNSITNVMPKNNIMPFNGTETIDFTSTEVQGNFEIIAQFNNDNPLEMLGLIAQQASDSNSKFSSITLMNNKIVYNSKNSEEEEGNIFEIETNTVRSLQDLWLRLTRHDNVIRSYSSFDGKTWRLEYTDKASTLPRTLNLGFIASPATSDLKYYQGDLAHSNLWENIYFKGVSDLSFRDNDPDQDGIPNILERALGLNPLDADRGNLLQFRFDNNNQLIDLEYPKSSYAADLTLEIETSSNMRTWKTYNKEKINSKGAFFRFKATDNTHK